ncbi:MAG: CvpA family protein, partial [Lachnospiraceae bacterium]|nr:CvpA family protein [Lachnospiraceae bacterium]
SNLVYGRVSKFLQNDGNMAENLQEKITASVEKKLDSHVNSKAEQVLAIEKLPLPEEIQKILIDNNNQEAYAQMQVSKFSDYISGMLTCVVMSGIAYLITFIILWIFFTVLMAMANMLTDFPLVGWIDSLGGLALGFAKGLFMVWVMYIFVTACSTTQWGYVAYRNIQNSTLMKLIYDNNLLSNVLYSLAKTIF